MKADSSVTPQAEAKAPDARQLDTGAKVDAKAVDATPEDRMIPDMTVCTANAFLRCSGGNAIYCGATGVGTTSFACGSGGCKSGDALTGCGQCTADTCAQPLTGPATFVTCDTAHDAITASGDCVTLKAGGNQSLCNGTACQQCAGSFVCGDGTSYGTSAGTQYACTGGVIQTSSAVACAFGCDPMNGQCRDMVPANQAASHLAAGDAFTCTGAQNPSLPAITVASGATLTIDTMAKTVTNGTTAVAGVLWGASYTPTGSGTKVVVAHIQSLTLGDGSTVTIAGSVPATGPRPGLVLLVDKGVTATGTSAMPTVIDVSASGYATGGPGANTATAAGAGGNVSATTGQQAGGGGAGYGDAGGKGGGSNGSTLGGGAGGMKYGAKSVLEAGAGGGRPNLSISGVQAASGLGGGALQITACGTISIGANVLINASGGGGQGGAAGPRSPTMNQGGGGAGGGSGGTILLEAAALTLPGSFAANGGGGGGGGTAGSTSGAGLVGGDGGNWDPTMPVTTAAAGGDNTTAVTPVVGGGGEAGSTVAGNGQSGPTGQGGGAGGGAFGAIYLNVAPGTAAPAVGAASPSPYASHVCVTANGAAPASCTY